VPVALAARRPLQAAALVLLLALSYLPLVAAPADSATGAPSLTLSRSLVELAPAYEDGGSSAATVVVTNVSTQPRAISAIGIMGNVLDEVGQLFTFGPQRDGGFTVQNGSTCKVREALPAGATCRLDIGFSPRDPGARTRWLKVAVADDPGSEYTVELRGEGLASVVDLTPSDVSFRGRLMDVKVPLGTTSEAQTVTFANTGESPVTVERVGSSADFPVLDTTCTSGLSLPAGRRCEVRVAFRPGAVGPRYGALELWHSGPGGVRRAGLAGDGSWPASGDGGLRVPSLELDLGSLQVGGYVDRTVRVENTGAQAVALQKLEVVGTVWDDVAGSWVFGPRPWGGFSATYGNCPHTTSLLAPGASCELNLRYNPTEAGPRTRWLVLTAGQGAGTTTITLKGDATAPPPADVPPGAGSVSPGILDAGSLPVGSLVDRVVQVRNAGPGPMRILDYRVHGWVWDDAFDDSNNGFWLSRARGDCGSEWLRPGAGLLQPGQSCPISLRFRPGAPGPHSRWLSVSTDSPQGTLVVDLHGAGDEGGPAVSLNRDVLSFGTVPTGTRAVRGLLVENRGSGALDVSRVSVDGPYTVESQDCSVRQVLPGEVCLVRVGLQPTAPGPVPDAALRLVSDAPGSPHVVPLVATAASRAPVVRVGGPYRAVVGRTTILAGSATDPDGDSLSFTWDLDGDGSFETPGASPELNPIGPSRDQVVGLRVCDAHGSCTTRWTVVRVRVAGRVVAWGADVAGSLGLPDGAARQNCGSVPCVLTPTDVDGLDDVTDVAAGSSGPPPVVGGVRSTVLRADGTVWTWSATSPTPAPVPGLEGVVALVAGPSHDVALTADGGVFTWGYGAYGILGRGGDPYYDGTPRKVSLPARAVAAAAGPQHTVVLLEDGRVMGWGFEQDRQLAGRCWPQACTSPVDLQIGDARVVALAASSRWTLTQDVDGTVRRTGLDPVTVEHRVREQLEGLRGTVRLAAGPDDHLLAAHADGSVLGLGSDGEDQLTGACPTVWSVRRCDTPIPLGGVHSTRVVAGGGTSFALRDDGSVLAWGSAGAGQLGTGTRPQTVATPLAVAAQRVQELSSSGGHGLAVVALPLPDTDTTAPTVTATAAEQSAWSAEPVTVQLAATDDTAVASLTWWTTGAQPSPPQTAIGSSRQVVVAAEGRTTVHVTARDAAGNASLEASVEVGVDLTPPTVSVTAPAGTHVLGSAVPAGYDCGDVVSGVASCSAPVPTGTFVDTSSVGSRIFAVTATDRAGRTARTSSTYHVTYALCPGSGQTSRTARPIPVRVQLCDAQGRNVSREDVPLTAVSLVQGDVVAQPVPSHGRTPGSSTFAFERGTATYAFSLDARRLTKGTWTLVVRAAGDPLTHDVPIVIG
jgi:alpha-tubulin suppressor-like RCC1 family protein